MAAAPLPPSTAPLPTPQPAGLSEGARIVNTFIAPSKTFTDLRRNASWWGPWLLISFFALVFIYSMDRQIGFDQISKNEIAHSAQADQFDKLPADQQQQRIRISSTDLLQDRLEHLRVLLHDLSKLLELGVIS